MHTDGADEAARNVWARQSAWSQAANAAKATIGRARALGLLLGMGAALSGAASSQTMEWNAAWGRTFAFVAAVTTGLLPLATTRCAPGRVRDWTRLRSMAEALKSELYQRLAQAGPYRQGPRDAVLSERLAALEADSADLLRYTDGITPLDRPLPAVQDAASYARVRVRQQIDEYYRPRALLMRRRLRTVRRVELALGVVSVVLAATGGALDLAAAGAWVAVVSTVSMAVVAHAAAAKYDYQELEFTRTALELERILARWPGVAEGSTADADASAEGLVERAEEVISVQNEAWMVKWQSE